MKRRNLEGETADTVTDTDTDTATKAQTQTPPLHMKLKSLTIKSIQIKTPNIIINHKITIPHQTRNQSNKILHISLQHYTKMINFKHGDDNPDSLSNILIPNSSTNILLSDLRDISSHIHKQQNITKSHSSLKQEFGNESITNLNYINMLKIIKADIILPLYDTKLQVQFVILEREY